MRKERRQIYIHCDVKHSVGRGYASRDRTTAPKWKILSDFLHKLLIEFDVRSGCFSRNKFSMRHLNTLLDLKISNLVPDKPSAPPLITGSSSSSLNFGEHEMKLNKFHFLTFLHSHSPSYRLVAEPKNISADGGGEQLRIWVMAESGSTGAGKRLFLPGKSNLRRKFYS